MSYPPCVSEGCADINCCAKGGLKWSWPELVGKPGEEAKATIMKDNPNVTAKILPPGTYTIFDFCCNRVWVKVDDQNIVIEAPRLG